MLSLLRSVRAAHCFYSTKSVTSTQVKSQETERFETVFSFPFVRYFALINRLKVYQFAGTGIVLPTSGLLEMLNVIPGGTFTVASYIGVTAAAVLSITTIPFHNIIGFIYISEDNKKIKIASVDYWGQRKDKLISAEDWIPLFELKTKLMDVIYLSPRLTDGTKYKLFLKFGKIQNSSKMSAILD